MSRTSSKCKSICKSCSCIFSCLDREQVCNIHVITKVDIIYGEYISIPVMFANDFAFSSTYGEIIINLGFLPVIFS